MALPKVLTQLERTKFIEDKTGKVAVRTYDTALIEINKPYSQLIEYNGNNPIYMGSAEPGSLTSEAKWQIRKLTYDANDNVTSILWADGDTEYDNVWDNRTNPTIIYS